MARQPMPYKEVLHAIATVCSSVRLMAWRAAYVGHRRRPEKEVRGVRPIFMPHFCFMHQLKNETCASVRASLAGAFQRFGTAGACSLSMHILK